LAAGLLAALLLFVPFATGAQDEDALLRRVEAYLNDIRTLEAKFVQVSSNGQFAEGTVHMARPGRMRIDYAPPVPVLIIADGTWLIYYDEELGQVSYLPLGSTPASILLEDRLRLRGGDVEVLDIETGEGAVRITLTRADNPGEGALTLVFSEEPMTLRRWTVVDAQGVETAVTLVDPRFGVPIDEDLFEFEDPEFFRDRFN
jgi:outer membrane lipoprotein-sorting protein